jgi:hypothetical protein
MTGFGIFATELNVKRLELLRAAFPNLSHVGVLYEPRQLEAGARSLGLRLTRLEVRRT